MAYISVIITPIFLQITFLSWSRPSVGSFHVLHLHLSFWLVGCYSCSCCTSVFFSVWSWISNGSFSVIFQSANLVEEPSFLLFSLHLSSLTCCVWTVAIRGRGVDHLIRLLFRTTSCCWNATLYLVSPSSSGSGCCSFEVLPFTFWSYLTP